MLQKTINLVIIDRVIIDWVKKTFIFFILRSAANLLYVSSLVPMLYYNTICFSRLHCLLILLCYFVGRDSWIWIQIFIVAIPPFAVPKTEKNVVMISRRYQTQGNTPRPRSPQEIPRGHPIKKRSHPMKISYKSLLAETTPLAEQKYKARVRNLSKRRRPPKSTDKEWTHPFRNRDATHRALR
jgi:hypothetical protein